MNNASYDAIDYNLRPAKAIERKMLAEMFRRLDRVHSLRHYRYVGFGSPYFTDFALFHRALDIQEMISIEREIDDAVRFNFNRPFSSVELKFGESTEVLPTLDWDQRSIVWLDYDDPLDVSMLDDLALCIRNAPSGSIVLMSCSAQGGYDPEERLADLRERLGTWVPPDLTVDDTGGWDLAALYCSILTERIGTAVRERNTGVTALRRIAYSQLINLQYQDGARMITVGGIVLDQSDDASYRQCAFDDFDFYRSNADPYRIRLPRLTPKEMRHLDELLPSGKAIDATEIGVPLRQSNRYADIYRYFPRYVDVEAH